MKAVAALREGQVEVVDIPRPEYADYECLVRVKACGICNSTDLKIIDNELSDWEVSYPCILGHESVGEVVEVGDRVKYIQPGDVFTNPIGRHAVGSRYRAMFGAMKDYAIVQDHRAMDELGLDRGLYTGFWTRPVSAEIGLEDATLLLTFKETYSALSNFGFRSGMDALVHGDGPVGLALVTFLRMGGAGWVGCVGHHDDRLERASEIGGADLTVNSNTQEVDEALGDRKFDMVIDAVGKTRVVLDSSRRLKPGGKVCIYGVLKKKDSTISLLDLQNHTSIHMLNWPVGEHEVHDEVVRMVLDGQINPKDFYSHVMAVDEAPEAIRKIRAREAFKVVLTF